MDHQSLLSFCSLSLTNPSLTVRPYGRGNQILFPPKQPDNGWIVEMPASEGLYLSSCWLTPSIQIQHDVISPKGSIAIFCSDCGQLEISQQGKAKKCLIGHINICVFKNSKWRLTLPKDVHACFTCILMSKDFLDKFTRRYQLSSILNINRISEWTDIHYDRPSVMLIMEQMRWSIRRSDMPLAAYEGMLLHLLCEISRHYPKPQKSTLNRRHFISWDDEKKIYAIKKHLQKDILNTPSIEELSKMAGMSTSKLRQAFKNTYKIPLSSFIRQELMKFAMQRLAFDNMSIQEIALECGYKNPSKFTLAFKNIHGITPSQFRQAFHL